MTQSSDIFFKWTLLCAGGGGSWGKDLCFCWTQKWGEVWLFRPPQLYTSQESDIHCLNHAMVKRFWQVEELNTFWRRFSLNLFSKSYREIKECRGIRSVVFTGYYLVETLVDCLTVTFLCCLPVVIPLMQFWPALIMMCWTTNTILQWCSYRPRLRKSSRISGWRSLFSQPQVCAIDLKHSNYWTCHLLTPCYCHTTLLHLM